MKALARPLLCLSLALVSLALATTPALAVGDWIRIEAALWRQDMDGTFNIGDALPGTDLDLQGTLGVDPDDNAKQARVAFRLGNSRLTFDAFDSSRGGSRALTGPIVFNDTVYAAETVTTDLDLRLLQAQYRYSFDFKVLEVGVGLGLNLAQVDMTLDGSSSGVTTLDEKVPYPTVNAGVVIKPFPGFHIVAEANGMSLEFSGNDVDILDARVQVEYYFLHAFGAFVGYRTYRFNVDAEDFGVIDSSSDGAYFGLGLKF